MILTKKQSIYVIWFGQGDFSFWNKIGEKQVILNFFSICCSNEEKLNKCTSKLVKLILSKGLEKKFENFYKTQNSTQNNFT